MRTTSVPAQITTVEDKIAGNLSLTQILLLLAPLLISLFIFAALPVRLHLTLYKLPFIAFTFLICLTLALRIKGKVVLNWLIVFSSFYLRPKLYLFDKNDPFLRETQDLFKDLNVEPQVKEAVETQPVEEIDTKKLDVADLVKVEQFISKPQTNLRLVFDKKGSLNVAFERLDK